LINRGNLGLAIRARRLIAGGSISPALIRSKRMARIDTIFASYPLVLQCVSRLSSAQTSASSLDIVRWVNSGWNFIQQELVATGVLAEDIEDNKSQIIKYVKDLVNDSLSQPEVEVQQNLGPGGSVSATHSANRRAFLANLDLRKTRTLSIGGKASVDFRIETILHGTFSGRPACMIVTDFWFHSDPTYRGDKGSYVAVGHIFMTVSPVQGRVSGDPEDVPVLVNSVPELMRGLRYTYRGTFSTEGLCTIWMVQSMRGESHRRI
jgi:hypothetical protein